MSMSLYWAPPPAAKKEQNIGYLKHVIGKYYDPEYHSGEINAVAGKEIIPFLKGVAAVGDGSTSQDALELIAAIEKYGEVELYTHS